MKTKKKNVVLCSLCGILFLSSLTFAQGDVTFSSTPNPVGSGARAIGMGGAFIAIADDATAASWNPAGLLQLKKPEFSIMTGYTYRNEDNYFAVHTEASGEQSFHSPNVNINYLSFVYPFNWLGRNMAISLSYQHLYDFNREFNFLLNYPPGAVHPEDKIEYNYEQQGQLYALGFSYCINFPDLFIGDLSVGATLNYWGDFLYRNRWNKKEKSKWNVFDITKEEYYMNSYKEKYENFDFKGWNANIGFMLRIKENLTIGGVIKTPFSAEILYEQQNTVDKYIRAINEMRQIITIEPSKENILDMPLSFGFGCSYRFSDEFTISIDIYRTLWDEFEMEDKQSGIKESPITGEKSDPITGEKPYNHQPTTSLRLGAEYRFMNDKYMIPLEFGIFYDPAPSKNDETDRYYGFSFGTGIEYNNIFSFYLSYQFRYGNDVGAYIYGSDFTFSQDLYEHIFYSSLVFYF